MSQGPSDLRRELSPFDFTLLVIGAIVGADVYIVVGLGAQFLGPAQLVAWVVAGVLAGFIGLAFVQCAAVCPEVGGSYAYAHRAFGPHAGFLTGWALYLGECVALPVFPIAFAGYIGYFLPVQSTWSDLLVKVLLVGGVTLVNLAGVRGGGRLNDILTVAKLVPLALLVLAAVGFIIFRTGAAVDHLTPFLPLGWGGFGAAVVVIFWAYAGFELAVLPATEVQAAERTLPRGLIIGMAVATACYLLTALAVTVALPWETAAGSTRPLADGLRAILDGLGLPGGWSPAFMSIGALISIAGVYDVFTLGVARLSYALAADGLFPPPFARVHHRLGTPWVGLAFQALIALGGSLFFDLSGLIAIAVFFLGVCYLMTALSAWRFVTQGSERSLHLPGLRAILVLAGLSGLYLSSQVARPLLAAGVAALAVGLIGYALRQQTWREAAASVRRGEQRVEHRMHLGNRWLLHFVRRRGVAADGRGGPI